MLKPQSFTRGMRLAAIAVAACASVGAHAGIVTWSITGPGITSTNQTGNVAALGYSQPGTAGFARTTRLRGVVSSICRSTDLEFLFCLLAKNI